MSRAIRPATERDAQSITRGIQLLREARDLFKMAGAPRTAQRIRLALTSAGGAERHASHRLHRTQKESR